MKKLGNGWSFLPLERTVHVHCCGHWIVGELMCVQANGTRLEVNIQQTHAQLALNVCQVTGD